MSSGTGAAQKEEDSETLVTYCTSFISPYLRTTTFPKLEQRLVLSLDLTPAMSVNSRTAGVAAVQLLLLLNSCSSAVTAAAASFSEDVTSSLSADVRSISVHSKIFVTKTFFWLKNLRI